MTQEQYERISASLAREDAFYTQLLADVHRLELEFLALREGLPAEAQEKLDLYIAVCEELEHRRGYLAANWPKITAAPFSTTP